MFEIGMHLLNARAIIGGVDARYRIGFLVAMFAAALAGLFFVEPVPQSVAYHGFADTRSWLGIPNFGDVASNLPFAFAGGYGLWRVLGLAGRHTFDNPADRWPYVFFFIGVGLVSVGSTYYHLAPDNARLFWDRLPMTVAFMALFSAFIADRIDRRIGVQLLLPILVVAGVASVFYWDWSESVGRGDLRFYFLVQFYPIVALPVICWLFPKGRHTGGGYLAWMIVWYAAAKVLETFDSRVFAILGNTASGHSLKHLASAVAVFVVVRMLDASRRSKPQPRGPRGFDWLKETGVFIGSLVGAAFLVGALFFIDPGHVPWGLYIVGILGVFPPLFLFPGDDFAFVWLSIPNLFFLVMAIVVESRVLLWRRSEFSFRRCLYVSLLANLASAVALASAYWTVLVFGLDSGLYHSDIVVILTLAWPFLVTSVEGLVLFLMRVGKSFWRSIGLAAAANAISLILLAPIVMTPVIILFK